MNDPRVRKDGLCARPGCEKKKPGASRYAGDAPLRDAFCSSFCCRTFHGCPIPGDEDPDLVERRSEMGRRGKAAGPHSDDRRVMAA